MYFLWKLRSHGQTESLGKKKRQNERNSKELKFFLQMRNHQKSKTGIPVPTKYDICVCPPKTFKKKGSLFTVLPHPALIPNPLFSSSKFF